MIHPNLATMLAVVTTDYPLEPGEALDVPPPRRRAQLQRDLGRRRVLDERRGRPARERRVVGAPRDDAAFAAALDAVCSELAAQIVADGEGATVVAEIGVTGAAIGRRGEGDRAADRDLAARQDGAVRPRRELGPGARRGGLGAVQRRLRAARPDLVTLDFDGVRVLELGAPRGVEPELAGADRARSSSTSASATGAASYLTSDLSYDYVRINADYRS